MNNVDRPHIVEYTYVIFLIVPSLSSFTVFTHTFSHTSTRPHVHTSTRPHPTYYPTCHGSATDSHHNHDVHFVVRQPHQTLLLHPFPEAVHVADDKVDKVRDAAEAIITAVQQPETATRPPQTAIFNASPVT